MAFGCVEVIYCDTESLAVSNSVLEKTLSAEERLRAQRFRFPERAHCYRAGRYLLRRALADKMGCTAREIGISIGEMGKPYLPDGPAFNMSDSRSMVVIAIADDGNLGVDIEHLERKSGLGQLVERYFSIEEREAFARLSGNERIRAFYRGWTRKEALIKALGGGLSIPLNSFTVSLAKDIENALLRGDKQCDPETWAIRPLTMSAEFEAAIAWDRGITRTEIRHIPIRVKTL